jgi:nucleoside-diphosphate-sugar epimerase
MHVFITGASGLIGSYTTQYLLDRGHSVTACDIVPLPDRIKLPEGSVFEIVDVTDFVAVEKAMLRIPCDGVIHLGAIPNPHVSFVGSSHAYANLTFPDFSLGRRLAQMSGEEHTNTA